MIYVMRVGARWKVGHSHDPVDRAYQLSGQHDWGEVAIVALGIGSEGDEAAIHKALAPLRARERKLEREYYADCDEFRLWRDAIDAFWRGNEVFCTERMRGIVTRPKVAFSLREAVRVGQRRYLGDLDGNCGRRLTWHSTAEQVLRGELRRGSVGGEQAAAVCVTLPVESARQREASRLFGPTGDGPPVAPTPHTWLVHAGAVRVSFRCRECFSKHTVPFPDRAVCYGAADPAQKAATILFGTVGPPSVDHHRGTLKQALV